MGLLTTARVTPHLVIPTARALLRARRDLSLTRCGSSASVFQEGWCSTAGETENPFDFAQGRLFRGVKENGLPG